jgi:hypothetical protein
MDAGCMAEVIAAEEEVLVPFLAEHPPSGIRRYSTPKEAAEDAAWLLCGAAGAPRCGFLADRVDVRPRVSHDSCLSWPAPGAHPPHPAAYAYVLCWLSRQQCPAGVVDRSSGG